MTGGPVAVVVCSRDRAALLDESLAAIRAVLRPGDELVVVDSASRDESVQATARAHGVRVLRVDRPGLGLARNAGWRATAAPVVLFTDDDCRPADGWPQAAVTALAADRVGIVWGRVLAAGDGSALALSTTDDAAPTEASLTGDLSSVGHGANMAMRREVLETIGGFDPGLGVGSPLPSAEDKDVFWRALRAGWRVRLAPEMAVTHVQWRDERETARQMYRYGVGAGALAAKRRRVGRDRGVLRPELWLHGLLPFMRAVRHGELDRARATASRTAGFAAGWWRGHRLPLHGDRFGRDEP